MKHVKNKKQKTLGFSLIELAIVMGVISLLVGGAVATSNVLDNAKQGTISKEITDIHRAYRDYRTKYGSIPGDTNNAETLFPGSSGSNGDGDGKLDIYPLEYNAFWMHLSKSGLLKGTYSIGSTKPGELFPESVLGNGIGYRMSTRTPERMVLQLCKHNNPSGLGAMTPAQIKQVDEQIDDGDPTSGRVVVEPANGVAATNCVSGGNYVATNTKAECNLLYVIEGQKFSNYTITGNGVASCGTITAPTVADYIWEMGDWSNCSGCAWSAGSSSDSDICGTVVRTTTYSCPSCSGTQTRTASCINAATGAVVANANCAGSAPATSRSCSNVCPEPAPATEQTVNLGACFTYAWTPTAWSDSGSCSATSSWSTGGWSGCNSLDTSCPRNGTQSRTVTCNQPSGTKPQTRSYYCRRSDGATVTDQTCVDNGQGAKPANDSQNVACTAAACNPGTEPADTQSCSVACDAWVCDGAWGACSGSASWSNPAWGACSVSCGDGTQTRAAATCNSAAGTQTKNCTCYGTFCGVCPINGGVTSDTNGGTDDVCTGSQACTDTTCDGPAPATSQACEAGTKDIIPMKNIQYRYRTGISGYSWVGCIKPD